MLSSVNYSQSTPCFGGRMPKTSKMSKKAMENFERNFPWGDEKGMKEFVSKHPEDANAYIITRILNGNKSAWQLMRECLIDQLKTMPAKKAQELKSHIEKADVLLSEIFNRK